MLPENLIEEPHQQTRANKSKWSLRVGKPPEVPLLDTWSLSSTILVNTSIPPPPVMPVIAATNPSPIALTVLSTYPSVHLMQVPPTIETGLRAPSSLESYVPTILQSLQIQQGQIQHLLQLQSQSQHFIRNSQRPVSLARPSHASVPGQLLTAPLSFICFNVSHCIISIHSISAEPHSFHSSATFCSRCTCCAN